VLVFDKPGNPVKGELGKVGPPIAMFLKHLALGNRNFEFPGNDIPFR
jgi:hypothetical protein